MIRLALFADVLLRHALSGGDFSGRRGDPARADGPAGYRSFTRLRHRRPRHPPLPPSLPHRVGREQRDLVGSGSRKQERLVDQRRRGAVLGTEGRHVRPIGKTTVRFYTGTLKPAPISKKPSNANRRRPADPFKALSGTVSDFEFKPEGPERDISRLPTPAPQPADPASYQNEDVYSLLTEIASSSWDSIYATASGPAAVIVAGQQKHRPLPVAGVKVAGSDVIPRRRHIGPTRACRSARTTPASASPPPTRSACPRSMKRPP